MKNIFHNKLIIKKKNNFKKNNVFVIKWTEQRKGILSSSGKPNIEASADSKKVDPRFGRCHYFIIIDTETLGFETIDNQNINSTGGAGIQSGQLMSEKGISIKLTLSKKCGITFY